MNRKREGTESSFGEMLVCAMMPKCAHTAGYQDAGQQAGKEILPSYKNTPGVHGDLAGDDFCPARRIERLRRVLAQNAANDRKRQPDCASAKTRMLRQRRNRGYVTTVAHVTLPTIFRLGATARRHHLSLQ